MAIKRPKSDLPADLMFDKRLYYVVNSTPGEMLNLGAGVNPVDGALNHDQVIRPGIQVAFDLLKMPWPLENNRFAAVLAFHVLEHLPVSYSLDFFKECHRILRPNGGIIIETPDMPRMVEEYAKGNVGMLGRMYGDYLNYGEGHVWGWDRHQLVIVSRLAGFKVCITKDGTDYHSGQIPTVRLEAIRH